MPRDDTTLPTYSPPHLPLSSTPLHDLSLLPTNTTSLLPPYLNASLSFLTASATSLLDSTRLPTNQPDSTFTSMSTDRERLLSRLESSVRSVCDAMAKNEFSIAAVGEVVSEEQERGSGGMTAEMRRQIRRGEREAGEVGVEAEEVGVEEGLVGRWREKRRRDWGEYENAGEQMKYGERNEYISYREALAEVRGEKFSKTKNLFSDSPHSTATPDDDSDSDIEIASEQRSFQCPLTMRPFIHPVTSKKCTAHTFEKEAILALFNPRKIEIKCPVSGCGNSLRKEDLVEDERVLRRQEMEVRREQRERRERLVKIARGEVMSGGESEGEDGGGDGGMGVYEGTQREIKKEKHSGTRRRKKRSSTVELSDDENEDME